MTESVASGNSEDKIIPTLEVLQNYEKIKPPLLLSVDSSRPSAKFDCTDEAQIGTTYDAYIYGELDYYGMEEDLNPAPNKTVS